MPASVTELLSAYDAGDKAALDELATSLYSELKQLAYARSRSSGNMGATTLVQETFVKLLGGTQVQAKNRQQFFALAATIMRQIIIDEVRYLHAAKRGGLRVTFAETLIGDSTTQSADFLLQVDDALDTLAKVDERLVRTFECRFFAGMSIAETAECLGVSTRTTERLWSESRARMSELFADV